LSGSGGGGKSERDEKKFYKKHFLNSGKTLPLFCISALIEFLLTHFVGLLTYFLSYFTTMRFHVENKDEAKSL
jgi:hypothetical protein